MVSSQSTQTSWQPTIAPELTLTTTQLGEQISSQQYTFQEPCSSSTWVLAIPPTADLVASTATPSNDTDMGESKCKQKKNWHSNATKEYSKMYPKPSYSYSCLIALALKNSAFDSLQVSEIYCFISDYFPYFRTAPKYWKNAVRHCLSSNKCFQKIEVANEAGWRSRRSWALDKKAESKMDEALKKWYDKNPEGITNAMEYPEFLSLLQEGGVKLDYTNTDSMESISEDEDEVEVISSTGNLSDPRLGTDEVISVSPPTIIINQIVQHSMSAPSHVKVTHTSQNQTIFSPIVTTPSNKRSDITVLDDPEIICLG